jgi:hypothetical protein
VQPAHLQFGANLAGKGDNLSKLGSRLNRLSDNRRSTELIGAVAIVEMPLADADWRSSRRVLSTIAGKATKQHAGDFVTFFTEGNGSADRRMVSVDCPTRILVFLFVKDRRLRRLEGRVLEATPAPPLQRASDLITQSSLPEAAQAS